MKPKIASNHDVSQYIYTCSADKPEDYCVTYATSPQYFDKLCRSGKILAVLIPADWIFSSPDNIDFIRVDDPEREFILWHNWINKHADLPKHEISKYARIHLKEAVFKVLERCFLQFYIINPGCAGEQVLGAAAADVPLSVGDVLSIRTPGSGGYGPAKPKPENGPASADEEAS